MAGKRVFGPIPGIDVGATFASREELRLAGVRRQLQAGISGSGYEGSEPIVLNGGYVDDEDYGKLIIYTGEGGQDQRGRQIRSQTIRRKESPDLAPC